MDEFKKIIGWREYVSLPDWGIKRIKAKIDTGAKSCSLHVEDIKKLKGNRISFYVILSQNKNRKKVTATSIGKGKVKSSIGLRTHRWYVQTKVVIGDIERTVKINLIGRDEMNFRMLIGRTALEDDFLVDVSHGYMLSHEIKRKKGKKKKSKKKK